ncbi:MAG: hypothetical protein ACRDMJ_19870, partial [Solirubrobacteraceae bacterium]
MRTLLRGLAGVAIVAAVGFLWARYGLQRTAASPPALDRHAIVANLSVSYPSSWQTRTAPADLALTRRLALVPPSPAHARLLIGTAAGVDPGRLPAAARTLLVSAPAPQLVTLGGLTFHRYLDARSIGYRTSESIYTLPTTGGTVVAVCSAPSRSIELVSGCERILATLRLREGTVLSLRPEPGYAFSLGRIMGQLDPARTAAASGLKSTAPVARERASAALAAADARAASEVRHLTGAGVAAANPALASALAGEAGGYRVLASALKHRYRAAYASAQA